MPGTNEQDQKPLAKELRSISQRDDETRHSFLSRLAGVAAAHSDEVLQETDLYAAGRILPDWEFDSKETSAGRLAVASRPLDTGTENAKQLSRHNEAGRRAVSLTKDGKIMLVAKSAFTGSDLRLIFEIEGGDMSPEEPAMPEVLQLVDDAPRDPDPPPEPKPAPAPKPTLKPAPQPAHAAEPKPPAKRKPPKKPKPEIIETPSGLRLRPRQAHAIRLLARPYAIGALQLSIEPNSFAKNVETAFKDNGIVSMEQFLETAMEDGLIDMEPLEQLTKPDLSSDEELALELTLFARKTGEEMESDPKMQAAFGSACAELGVDPDKPYQRALTFIRAKYFGYI